MFPRKGDEVKFSNTFLSVSVGFAKYAGKKITICKLDLLCIKSNGTSEYNVFFTDDSSINSVIVSDDGKDTIHNVEVFEDWEEAQAPVNGTYAPIFATPPASSSGEPRNNDGRRSCWWCKAPTVSKPGLFSNYDICPKCNK